MFYITVFCPKLNFEIVCKIELSWLFLFGQFNSLASKIIRKGGSPRGSPKIAGEAVFTEQNLIRKFQLLEAHNTRPLLGLSLNECEIELLGLFLFRPVQFCTKNNKR